ncbi:MAG: RNA 2',3'-cyclic phosphodiesterase [Planctomycetota bacterium]
MSERIRCFVAVTIDAAISRRLEREIGYFQLAGADVKWVPRDSFHLTVSFLGDLEPELLIDVEEQLEEAAQGVARMKMMVRGVAALPDLDRPRVIAAGFDGDLDKFKNLQRDLKGRFRSLGIRADKKIFAAHVTLGRVRGDRHLDELKTRLAKSLNRRFGMLSVTGVELYMSDQGPKGPIYTPLKRFSLI